MPTYLPESKVDSGNGCVEAKVRVLCEPEAAATALGAGLRDNRRAGVLAPGWRGGVESQDR